jgi:eukaryotic-like serine/threonine-protein kinase
MNLGAGNRFDRYEILSPLGKGGMGEVYLAQDARLRRKVALKLLPREFTLDPGRVRRFELEAQAASALNHPNIITIHEIGEAAGSYFIAMEFIDGRTLRQRMASERMELMEILDVAVQVAGGLTEAHNAGIIHRDIKPENVMVRPDGFIKVLDFGLAKLTESSSSIVETEATTAGLNTATGAVMGTPKYMSPEQVRALDLDARSDIFSFGAVLYEMIAGGSPFQGTTTGEITGAILFQALVPLSRVNASAPAELDRIVSKALEKDRERRYQSVKELLVDLKQLKRRLEVEAEHGKLPAAITSRELVAAPVAPARRYRLGAIFVVSVLLVIGLGYWSFSHRLPDGTTFDSIAVMPFDNLTHDEKIEYLSDGVTDSLINSLSELPNIKVIARSSVFSYKNQTPDLRQVAQRLNVQAVLTGRVLAQDNALDIRVELTDPQHNLHLWGEHYTRKTADIFAVQDEIARQVTDALRVRLSAGQQEQVTKRYTQNADAYRLYLQGRFQSNEGSEENVKRAVSLFDQAIALDPRYALAYAARAETYFGMGDISLPMREAKKKVEQDIASALSIDDKLAEARMTRANLEFQYDWDFARAEDDFKRVIALNPNLAEAHHQYSYYLALTGRPMDATVEMKLAQQLDPVNPSIVADMTLPFLMSRQFDQAIAQSRQALDMFPDLFLPHMGLGSALFEKGDRAAGVQELKKAAAIDPNPIVTGLLGNAYAKSGRKDEARQLLDELKKKSTERYVAPYWIAMIYVGLDEKDEAFAWLEKAYQERSWWLVWIKMEPMLDGLRNDPRFVDLMRRVGFP